MSTSGPLNGRNRLLFPTLPRGEVVATFESYPAAQEAVDVLARADFPVDKVSIIGSDLKSVERVTGKLTWGRVALAGAASGAWLGIFFGLLLIIFSPSVSLGFVLAALLIGAGFGMLWGVATYAINRRRRDFTSVQQVIATSYSVLVDSELGNRARNLLGEGGAEAPAAAATGWTPPAQPQHPSDPPPAPPAAAPPIVPPAGDERPPAPSA
ncbi:general stress protein [Leifsonia sp. fls2-241-R2A-40a]|uniref:general stress protein n=1 Tax=Leifsonia sp. fls2-241-R2A-40a TaxID=3040290 RepID=UPI002551B6E2|nr:general stress protein [Leifsonia sp. fls2-241-R2A-40a]